MKIAEALRERADLQKELAQLKHRIAGNARAYEGDSPDEDPQALLDRVKVILSQLEGLVARINITNAATQLDESVTLTQAMAKRDYLNRLRTFLTEAAEAAGGNRRDLLYGRSRSEVKEVAALPVKALREEADRISADQRALDTKIQVLNWSTDLL
jgi:hypothetical protein